MRSPPRFPLLAPYLPRPAPLPPLIAPQPPHWLSFRPPTRFRLRIDRRLSGGHRVSVTPAAFRRPPPLPYPRRRECTAAACPLSLLPLSMPTPGLGGTPLHVAPQLPGEPRRGLQDLGRDVWGQEFSSGLHWRFGEEMVRDLALAPPHPTLALRGSPVPPGEIRCFVRQRTASFLSSRPTACRCYLRSPEAGFCET